ncbi:MAG: hypothetical protein EBV53_10135, partial [Proteobacteria bacterium]|nr:hypothetical protein [Pseudomonadota bacterium]
MTTAPAQPAEIFTPKQLERINAILGDNQLSASGRFDALENFMINSVSPDQRAYGFCALITTHEKMKALIEAERGRVWEMTENIIFSLPAGYQVLAAWRIVMASPAMQDLINAASSEALEVAENILPLLDNVQRVEAWKAMMANPAMQEVIAESERAITELGNILDHLTSAELQEAGIVTREIRPGDVEHDTRERYSGSVYVVPHDLLPKALQANTGEYQTIIRFDDMQMTADQWAMAWQHPRDDREIARASMATMLRATAEELARPQPSIVGKL